MASEAPVGGLPGVRVAGRLAGRSALNRVAEGTRLVALVALGAYCTNLGCDLPARGCTARGSGATGQDSGVLHEGPGLVQYGQPLASTPPPSCSSRPEGAPAGRGPLIEHRRESDEGHQEPGEGPGVQIGDKGSDRCHPGGAKPHDSKVLVHAVWGSGGPLSPIRTPPG